MEKTPEFRIVGNASAEKKAEVKKELADSLFSHLASLSKKERDLLRKFEYPKTEQERALIGFANRETDRLMEEAGVEPYDIPEENYHIVPTEIYQKTEPKPGDSTATTLYHKQGIWLDAAWARSNAVSFGSTSFHETLHLKGHFSAEVNESGGGTDKSSYREGVAVRSLQRFGLHGKEHVHFFGLHEAIVSEQQKGSHQRLLEEPALAEERKWLTSNKAEKLRAAYSQKYNIPEDDITWVGKDGDWKALAYREQRDVLAYVCEEIQKEFPGTYPTADDVFKEFLRAHFTGQLPPIARLTEKTFGEGKFRLLGNMSDDKESAVLALESLKKARALHMRSPVV